MAANSSSRGITNLGKRFVDQIWTRDPSRLSAPVLRSRRAAHTSAYDKNPDEQTQSSVVPDDLIEPKSDKYWAPHPQTGVFGPATGHTTFAGGRGAQAAPADGGEGSVLEQTAWFRPTSIEDLEKPAAH
ncbi:late embryogenesis abundant protein At5g17165 [Humulus lupulus]|uniref:late embryogenesis abundant protein At5g17165 n=1 Tax=Humulus lupulus TaxID=3486 RepID=UPI002B40F140|nr:late embryogenesis abundant protein At5g17165 [Humulus lupulus]